MYKVGFIGMGNMASAIIHGCIKEMVDTSFYGYDIDATKVASIEGMEAVDSIELLIEKSQIIVLAVKPNVVEGIIKEHNEAFKDKAVISIVAGYLQEQYRSLFDASTRILSIMPNTPAMVKQGVTLFEQSHTLGSDEYAFATAMFTNIGMVQVLPTYQMAAATAISGCGPAFVYMMIESLGDGAVKLGLPRSVAYALASQTLIGAGTMQKETNIHPGILKDNVCSPGGITIKGVNALEENGFRSSIIKAVTSTTK